MEWIALLYNKENMKISSIKSLWIMYGQKDYMHYSPGTVTTESNLYVILNTMKSQRRTIH